jgi:hypothetical protein
METLNKDQEKDIKTRQEQGLKLLEELNLTPSAAMYPVNMGSDIFGVKMIAYLSDTKYLPKKEDKK